MDPEKYDRIHADIDNRFRTFDPGRVLFRGKVSAATEVPKKSRPTSFGNKMGRPIKRIGPCRPGMQHHWTSKNSVRDRCPNCTKTRKKPVHVNG